MKVIWLRRPLKKFELAVSRIADDDPGAAARQFRAVNKQTARLGEHPHLGRPSHRPGHHLLSIAGTPFLIFYRIRPRARRIEIYRFVHTRQNWQV